MAINLDQVESQVAAAGRGNPAVARAQAILAQLGHYSSRVDGIVGNGTRTAITKLIENQAAFEGLSSSDRAQIQVAITALSRTPLNAENGKLVANANTRIDEFQRTCGAREAALQAVTPAAPATDAATPAPAAPAAEAPAAPAAAEAPAAPAAPVPTASVPLPLEKPPVPATAAERIREAQRVLHGRGYYPEGRTEDKAVDGIIGRETRAAIAKANEAVVSATANGKECPPDLKDVASAHQTLVELGGQEAERAAAPAQRQNRPARPERAEGEAAERPNRRRPRQAEAGGEEAERPKRRPQRQAVTHGEESPNRRRAGGGEEQPHLRNRGEKYGNEIQGMHRWSDSRIVKELGESYRGAPVFHVGPTLPESRGNRVQPSTERELIPLQTRPSAKHPNGVRAWVPNGWHFDLNHKLRDHSVTLPPNEFYKLQPGTGVVLDSRGKPMHGVTPKRPGSFGEIRESSQTGGDSGVGTGGTGSGSGSGGGCCGGGPSGGSGGPGGGAGGGAGGASLDPTQMRPDVLEQLKGQIPLIAVASADVAPQSVPDARNPEQRDRNQTQVG